MTRRNGFIAGLVAPGAALVALGAAWVPAAAVAEGQDRPDRTWLDAARKPRAAGSQVGAREPVSGLPQARGREFRTLDAYLAHLEEYAAPMDRPWYRQVRPGLYRLETGNLRADVRPRLFTREQLERRFGFRR